MTKEDIIRMAREAGAAPPHNPELWDVWNISDQALERFAALVAAEKDKKIQELEDIILELQERME